MKLSEYRDEDNNVVVRSVRFNEDDDRCFEIAEALTDGTVLSSTQSAWVEAEILEMFLRKHRKDAEAVDEEWEIVS